MLDAGLFLCREKMALGSFKEVHDRLVLERRRIGKVDHDLRAGKGYFEPLAGDGVDARIWRGGEDLVTARAQNGDGLRADQAGAADDYDLHDGPSLPSSERRQTTKRPCPVRPEQRQSLTRSMRRLAKTPTRRSEYLFRLRRLALTGPLWQEAGRFYPRAFRRCSSSVVEHSLGKGEVESSILSCSTRPGAAMGRQARRAGSLQDLSENSASEAAMTAEPMKNVGSMTKCKSAIQRESASDMSAVSAGTRFRNMVTKPLSPPVTVSATWYMTRPRDAATIVPKIISPIAGS